MNKHESNFLDFASKLDALSGNCGSLTKYASSIVDKYDNESMKLLLKQIGIIVDNNKESKEILRMAIALKESLYIYCGYSYISEICNNSNKDTDNRSLEELLLELDNLIGLKNVKRKVNDLIAFQKIQILREKNNLFSTKGTLHLAFIGNPGTGKTTVARIVGRIYNKIGLLSKGHFIEASRTDLIAGYQGQTALKVKNVIEKAKGGVLFIDEAYSITENENSDSYGKECLTELTKALEDYRDDLVVIVAGYSEPMKKFFDSNPGLKSRFNTFIDFEDYSAEELQSILKSMCEKNDYILTEEAVCKIKNTLEHVVNNKDNNFANGRLVRNIYDDIVMNHARRVIKMENPGKMDLSMIIAEDISVNVIL